MPVRCNLGEACLYSRHLEGFVLPALLYFVSWARSHNLASRLGAVWLWVSAPILRWVDYHLEHSHGCPALEVRLDYSWRVVSSTATGCDTRGAQVLCVVVPRCGAGLLFHYSGIWQVSPFLTNFYNFIFLVVLAWCCGDLNARTTNIRLCVCVLIGMYVCVYMCVCMWFCLCVYMHVCMYVYI